MKKHEGQRDRQINREGKRGRERDSQREKQKGRERERDTEMERGREMETERDNDAERGRETETDGERDIHALIYSTEPLTLSGKHSIFRESSSTCLAVRAERGNL